MCVLTDIRVLYILRIILYEVSWVYWKNRHMKRELRKHNYYGYIIIIHLLHTLPLNTEIYYYRGGNISRGWRPNEISTECSNESGIQWESVPVIVFNYSNTLDALVLALNKVAISLSVELNLVALSSAIICNYAHAHT